MLADQLPAAHMALCPGGDGGLAIDGVSFVTKTGTGDILGSQVN